MMHVEACTPQHESAEGAPHLRAGHELEGVDKLVLAETVDGDRFGSNTSTATGFAPKWLITKEMYHECGTACMQACSCCPGTTCTSTPPLIMEMQAGRAQVSALQISMRRMLGEQRLV
jgi:hypothetical protein